MTQFAGTRLPAEDRALTLAEAARIMRDALKDRSYLHAGPVGTHVGRYLRWLRNEWGATPATIKEYEAVLARMAIQLGHRELFEVSVDDLRDVIDLWSTRAARTRQKVTSIVRAFWTWCEEQGHVAISPANKIRRPRAEQRVARVLPLTARPRLLSAAKHPRDRLALFCLLELGLRSSELSGIRFRDFDPDRGWVRVFGKGRKERVLPLRGLILVELRLCLSADLPGVGRPPEGDDYLLYPMPLRAAGRGREGEVRRRRVGEPKRRMHPATVHRWWYGCAQAAGLVGPGVASGLNMHRARHTFAMELRRVAGIDAASHALGHADLNTTLGIYGHQDDSDLESAMEAYAAWRQQDIAPEDSP